MNPTYIDEVEMTVDSFRYELCSNCLGDLDRHVIAPDPLGHVHLYCLDEVA
jgi:hypothetical protein